MKARVCRRVDKAFAVALLLAIISFTACSPSGESKAAEDELITSDYTKPSSVCSLLTKSDLEIMLGHRYEAGTSQAEYDQKLNRRVGGDPEGFTLGAFTGLPGITPCMYFSPESSSAFVATGVATSLVPYIWKQAKGGSEVKGLGKEAFWEADRGQMLVLADDKIFGLQVRRGLSENPGHHRERARRLALKALSRLQ